MKSIARMGLLAATLTALAMAASAAKAPTYIFSGYSFGPIPGANIAELEAKLPHKAGDRITMADVHADQIILAEELRARHLEGRLFASTAEKHGRVWIIFDLIKPPKLMGDFGNSPHHLESQSFEGESHLSASALAAATGLRPGDPLSPEKMLEARQAIAVAYAKAMPGKLSSLKARMRIAPDGGVTLTWIIGEPQ
jgi:hypothetical protein